MSPTGICLFSLHSSIEAQGNLVYLHLMSIWWWTDSNLSMHPRSKLIPRNLRWIIWDSESLPKTLNDQMICPWIFTVFCSVSFTKCIPKAWGYFADVYKAWEWSVGKGNSWFTNPKQIHLQVQNGVWGVQGFTHNFSVPLLHTAT